MKKISETSNSVLKLENEEKNLTINFEREDKKTNEQKTGEQDKIKQLEK